MVYTSVFGVQCNHSEADHMKMKEITVQSFLSRAIENKAQWSRVHGC